MYLYISSDSGVHFSSTGQIANGYFPQSFDCSDNGNYITILMYNTNVINAYCSYDRGVNYYLREILSVDDESIQSVTPIKLSGNGKVQEFFVSFNSELSSKMYRCNINPTLTLSNGDLFNFSSIIMFLSDDSELNIDMVLNSSMNMVICQH